MGSEELRRVRCRRSACSRHDADCVGSAVLKFLVSLDSGSLSQYIFRKKIYGVLWQGVEDYHGLVGAGYDRFGDGY